MVLLIGLIGWVFELNFAFAIVLEQQRGLRQKRFECRVELIKVEHTLLTKVLSIKTWLRRRTLRFRNDGLASSRAWIEIS